MDAMLCGSERNSGNSSLGEARPSGDNSKKTMQQPLKETGIGKAPYRQQSEERTTEHHQGHLAMGQNPVPPVNIPIPTKIGFNISGAPIPKWDPIGFEPWPSTRSSSREVRTS